jgi:hypothetical protein
VTSTPDRIVTTPEIGSYPFAGDRALAGRKSFDQQDGTPCSRPAVDLDDALLRPT